MGLALLSPGDAGAASFDNAATRASNGAQLGTLRRLVPFSVVTSALLPRHAVLHFAASR